MRAIEDLVPGDLVLTRDNGAQPLRWIGQRALDAIDLCQRDSLRPIRIKAGALGQNVPETDLLVSPQHRILVRSRIAGKMFGASEVLVAANGAPAETLYLGQMALEAVGRAALAEIRALFPELLEEGAALVGARLLISGRQGRRLAVRHAQNQKPVYVS